MCGGHGLFEWCDCCNRSGAYYYGDRAHSKRAVTLELVLEAIERDHMDGSAFTTWGLACGIWGGRVYGPLRWLENRGLIERLPRSGSTTLNRWRVVRTP